MRHKENATIRNHDEARKDSAALLSPAIDKPADRWFKGTKDEKEEFSALPVRSFPFDTAVRYTCDESGIVAHTAN